MNYFSLHLINNIEKPVMRLYVCECQDPGIATVLWNRQDRSPRPLEPLQSISPASPRSLLLLLWVRKTLAIQHCLGHEYPDTANGFLSSDTRGA